MGDGEDFWPAFDNAEDPNSPVVVLRKQAQILTDKSGHRLVGRISTQTFVPGAEAREMLGLDRYENSFTHMFKIEVPALDDYSYTLFSIAHGIDPYPVVYEDDNHQWRDLPTAEAFTDWLKETLASPKTKRILKTLTEQAG